MTVINNQQARARSLDIAAPQGCFIDRTNRRLVVNAYPNSAETSMLAADWIELAESHDLEKIWVWSFLKDVPQFLNQGFSLEGIIHDNALNRPAASLAYYLSTERSRSKHIELEKRVLAEVSAKEGSSPKALPSALHLRILTEQDSSKISGLLDRVFATYPSPVSNPNYVKELMKKGCIFAGAIYKDKLVSVAAAYPDEEWFRCEITDCATANEFRGHSLTERLIRILEPEVAKLGAFTLYTLARARSFAMNRVFYKLGYHYQGRLLNNCDIAGGFEDMNLWVKYSKE